ncbi:MAG: hypothetical protein IT370_14160 [Deltaproteobacteria bacterium]|nr:hypothetical protein [Deltaproteobacteria bacterium]
MRPRLRASRPVLTFVGGASAQSVVVSTADGPPGVAGPGAPATETVDQVVPHLEGPHHGEFAVTPTEMQRMPASGGLEFRVGFTPRAPGARAGALVVSRALEAAEPARVTLIGHSPPGPAPAAGAPAVAQTTAEPVAVARAAPVATEAEAPAVVQAPRRMIAPQAASDLIAGMVLIEPRAGYLGAAERPLSKMPTPYGGTIMVDPNGAPQPVADPMDLSVGSISAGPRGGRIGDGSAHRAYSAARGDLSLLRIHNEALRRASGGVVASEGRLSQRERLAVATAREPKTEAAGDLAESAKDVGDANGKLRVNLGELRQAEKELSSARFTLAAIEADIEAWGLELRHRKTGKQIATLRETQQRSLSRVRGLLSYAGKMLKFASKITRNPTEALGEGLEGLAAITGAGSSDGAEVTQRKAELARLEGDIVEAKEAGMRARAAAAHESLAAALFGVDTAVQVLRNAVRSRSGEYAVLGKRLEVAVIPKLGVHNRVGGRVARIPLLQAIRAASANIDTLRLRNSDDPAQIADADDATYATWLRGALPSIADAVDALRGHADTELAAASILTDSLGIDP